jgi:hypothetical protein
MRARIPRTMAAIRAHGSCCIRPQPIQIPAAARTRKPAPSPNMTGGTRMRAKGSPFPAIKRKAWPTVSSPTDGRSQNALQHNPQNAQRAQVSGEAGAISRADCSHNPASALGAKVVIWLEWSSAAIAKHVSHLRAGTWHPTGYSTSAEAQKFHDFGVWNRLGTLPDLRHWSFVQLCSTTSKQDPSSYS